MLDLRAPVLRPERGERLVRDDYRSDFRQRRAEIRNRGSWKLERLQHFEEVDDASRDALRRGDWQEALRLFAAERAALRASAREQALSGAAFHRIRVVEEPLTPYVQWELHWLRLSAECGHRVRVLPAAAVAASEAKADGLLPEVTLLDDRVLYRVLYTGAGRPDGAIRYTDPKVLRPWSAWLRDAYAAAEDVLSFFDRVVAPLPPPPAA
jgi:hypothetical protein